MSRNETREREQAAEREMMNGTPISSVERMFFDLSYPTFRITLEIPKEALATREVMVSMDVSC